MSTVNVSGGNLTVMLEKAANYEEIFDGVKAIWKVMEYPESCE